MTKLPWRNQEQEFLDQNALHQTISTLEDSIQADPTNLTSYWNLGLAYLLEGEEEAAQLVWLSAIAEQNAEDYDKSIRDLAQTLSTCANQLIETGEFQQVWVIRHHIREFLPQEPLNLLYIIELSIKLNKFSDELLSELGILKLFQEDLKLEIDLSDLIRVLEQVLQFPFPETLHFAKVCFPYLKSDKKWSKIIISAAVIHFYSRRLIYFAIALIELCLECDPNNIAALGYLPRLLIECHRYTDAVAAAKRFYNYSSDEDTRFFSCCILLQSLMRAGDWNEIPIAGDEVKFLIYSLIKKQSTQLPLNTIQFLILNASLFVYLQDNIVENRRLQNQAAQLFLKNIEANASASSKSNLSIEKEKGIRLRIGYIASTFRTHSVSWLCRWLFKYHDRERFEIYIYLVKQAPQDDFFNKWFVPYIDQYRYLDNGIDEAVDILRHDSLDILIDLDSLTLDFTCTVLAFKPAPIQATWLAGDASGLPTIDYFIADSYVLPDNAQSFYQETIWKLPQTYIAVDGFEIGIPTLRRSDLNIPVNAVIYWSSQVGYKRNPSIIRLQMRILKEVPNSYFLIKGLGDQDTIRDFFIQIAVQEGVLPEYLRFIDLAPDELTHRANLQIADIVLDTYPYNGATTTLETLWAGVPLVTRVGQQFAARNSYAFMMNVGVTEGIAWTDEEYVEWGIRFGKDELLRQQVAWKLKQSRHTSPLWNARQFTRDMEDAYREMWAIYAETNSL